MTKQRGNKAGSSLKALSGSEKRAKAKAEGVEAAVERVPSRDIRDTARLLLYVRAGGRCEFDGCNKYLVRHSLTHDEGNYGQMAHIVAFKPEGPRGRAGQRPQDINSIENLMLLCPECHHLVDKERPQDYPRTVLERYKHGHEERIFRLTATQPDRKTTVVQLKSKIGGQAVDIPVAHVREAVAPRYPDDPRGCIIDLTQVDGEGEDFYRAAQETIRRKVQRLYEPGMDVETTQHISLFALAPIPLLVYLGSQLGNKVAVEPYQRHRDTEDWIWKTDGDPVGHKFRRVRQGRNKSKVALLLTLSGPFGVEDLPPAIDKSYYVYEITVAQGSPTPTYLRLRQDLTNFKMVYQQTLRAISKAHPLLGEIHLFPAVPAPVAVLCGRELLPKVDPALLVYDNDKRSGGFRFIFKVNEL
jgi:hypothetical protein